MLADGIEIPSSKTLSNATDTELIELVLSHELYPVVVAAALP